MYTINDKMTDEVVVRWRSSERESSTLHTGNGTKESKTTRRMLENS